MEPPPESRDISWLVLHNSLTMLDRSPLEGNMKCVGRAVTMRFVPARPDISADKPPAGDSPEYEVRLPPSLSHKQADRPVVFETLGFLFVCVRFLALLPKLLLHSPETPLRHSLSLARRISHLCHSGVFTRTQYHSLSFFILGHNFSLLFGCSRQYCFWLSVSASEERGNNLETCRDVDLRARARIWP
jgi:hypothetical protein